MILRSSRKVLVHTADRLRYATDLARYGLTRPRPLYDRRLQKVIREIRRSDWVPRANGCAGECGPDSVEQLRSSFNDTLAHRFRFFGKDEVFQTPGPECPLCGRHARLWGDAYRPIEWHADGLFGGCYPALDCPRSALNRTRSRRMEIKWPWELSRVQHLPALALAVHVLRDEEQTARAWSCLLYTSDAADDLLCVDLGGRRIIKKKIQHNTTTSITTTHKQSDTNIPYINMTL